MVTCGGVRWPNACCFLVISKFSSLLRFEAVCPIVKKMIQTIFSYTVSAVLVISVLASATTYAAPADTSISASSNSVLDQAAGLATSAVELKSNLLSPPEKSRESAKLESEGLPSRILDVYDDKQQKTINAINVSPIIDTITEQEKYGNSGQPASDIGRSIVNSYEVFANLLNRVFEKPDEFARAISRGITAQLDIIGGRLVGLA